MFGHKHKWTTVAIDTSNGYTSRNKHDPDDKGTGFAHIIKFMKCSCGARKIEADDPTKMGREFAMEQHIDIGLQRTIWVESGEITGYDQDKITWVDTAYAPLRGFEKHLSAMKADPELKDLLSKHSMVYDALGELEVAIKLQ
jgi:hypothetical protein